MDVTRRRQYERNPLHYCLLPLCNHGEGSRPCVYRHIPSVLVVTSPSDIDVKYLRSARLRVMPVCKSLMSVILSLYHCVNCHIDNEILLAVT